MIDFFVVVEIIEFKSYGKTDYAKHDNQAKKTQNVSHD